MPKGTFGKLPLTPEEIQRTRDAMIQADGSRTAAAKLLGIPVNTLHDRLRRRKSIARNLPPAPASQPPLSDEEILSRDPLLHPKWLKTTKLLTGEKDLALSLDKEDLKLAKGLDAIGLNAKERDYARSLNLFANQNLSTVSGMVSVGVFAASIKLMQITDEVFKSLRDGPPAEITTAPERLEWEKMKWSALHNCMENLIRIESTTKEGELIRAKIRAIRSEMSKQNSAPAHGRFAPQPLTQVNIAPGNSVQINENARASGKPHDPIAETTSGPGDGLPADGSV